MTPRLKKIADIIKQDKGVEQRYREVRKVTGEIHTIKSCESRELTTREFIRTWAWWFGTRLIHFEDWQDICEEGLALTLKFIESDLEEATEMEGYKDFMDKVDRRIFDELPKSDKYTELQKRCWHDMGY